MITLRDYQADLVHRVRVALREHRRVCAQAPTGAGKTVMFAFMSQSASSKGNSIVISAHRQEICDQISRTLDAFGVPHGFIAAGRSPSAHPIQVAMIQTLARRLDRIPEPALWVIDECHHSVAGVYATVAQRWQRARHLGFTATPERLDGKGLSAAFDDLVLGPSVGWLIENGHLACFDYYAPPIKADLSQLRSRMGDYAVDDVAMAMDRAVVHGDAIQHYGELLNGRPAVAFCVTREHAEHVAAAFRAQGWRAASIDGTMDKSTRRGLLDALATGGLHVLTSCELISEGVDVPVCSGAILLRPTKSLSMFLQQVGRVLRLKPDGSRAVILDHVGNAATHGLPDSDRDWTLSGRPKKPKEPSVGQCKSCFRVFGAGATPRVTGSCPDARPDCDYLSGDQAAARKAPEQVDGKLERLTASDILGDVSWALGIDVRTARGEEFKALLQLTGGKRERLNQIAKARGYKPGWAHHMAREMRERVAA